MNIKPDNWVKVGRDGFEPPKALPADLQSAPFVHFGTCPLGRYWLTLNPKKNLGLSISY